MPELPRIGDSLDQSTTLEAQSRKTRLAAAFCSQCKTSPYPRGFVINLGLCWYCAFPSVGTAIYRSAREEQVNLKPKYLRDAIQPDYVP